MSNDIKILEKALTNAEIWAPSRSAKLTHSDYMVYVDAAKSHLTHLKNTPSEVKAMAEENGRLMQECGEHELTIELNDEVLDDLVAKVAQQAEVIELMRVALEVLIVHVGDDSHAYGEWFDKMVNNAQQGLTRAKELEDKA